MDIINGSSRPRHKKTPSFDRFLTITQTTQNDAAEETELSEDDIFSTGDFSADSLNHHRHSPPSSAASTPRKPSFLHSDSFGILAALPELRPNPHHHQNHNFYQKSMLSTVSSSTSPSPASSTSSARMIPAIPRAAPPYAASGMAAKAGYHQSAPVNVPVLTEAMRRRRGEREFEEVEEEESGGSGGDGEMLPPHEMVARQQTPMVACSVLEGVGRTLKGRDLRQVRNAVFRRTGFLD